MDFLTLRRNFLRAAGALVAVLGMSWSSREVRPIRAAWAHLVGAELKEDRICLGHWEPGPEPLRITFAGGEWLSITDSPEQWSESLRKHAASVPFSLLKKVAPTGRVLDLACSHLVLMDAEVAEKPETWMILMSHPVRTRESFPRPGVGETGVFVQYENGWKTAYSTVFHDPDHLEILSELEYRTESGRTGPLDPGVTRTMIVGSNSEHCAFEWRTEDGAPILFPYLH